MNYFSKSYFSFLDVLLKDTIFLLYIRRSATACFTIWLLAELLFQILFSKEYRCDSKNLVVHH